MFLFFCNCKDGQDTALKWHQGPDMNHARGYAAVFTANCKLYVAGGTVDKLGTKYAEDMNLVEVYSTTSTSTGGSSDGLRSMANGYWSRTKDILQNVSHVEAVVLYNPETKQESGMLMGGKKNPPSLQSFQPRLADCSLVLLSHTHPFLLLVYAPAPALALALALALVSLCWSRHIFFPQVCPKRNPKIICN